MHSKSELRRTFRNLLLEGQSDEARTQATKALNERLVQLLKGQSGLWAAYQPTGFEPDIRPALNALKSLAANQERSITWVYPRVEGAEENPSLGFYLPQDEGVLTLNRWGILEPDPNHSKRVELAELKGILIPGLAFDRRGYRLGRGGGYYDRALAAANSMVSVAKSESQNTNQKTGPIKIGIALDLQIAKTDLPVEPFDIAVDWVITESRSLGREGDPASIDSLSERKSS